MQKRTRSESAIDALMARIQIAPSGCWLWKGYVRPSGYGEAWLSGTRHMAHRATYEHMVGPVPDGLELDHLCRVRDCVNPKHLEPVTRQTNQLRGETVAAANAAKTHCINGHPFSGDNLLYERTKRRCRECRRASVRRWRAKQAAT